MTAEAWQIVFFTIEVSALSTLLILPLGVAVAWLIARREWPGKAVVETVAMLPLFVPPVATGLVLLMLFSRAVRSARCCNAVLAWKSCSPGARLSSHAR